jgi:anti-sigma factor RsiW
MTCNQAANLIAAYADREVEGLRRHRLAKHLRGCPNCTARVEELVTLHARIWSKLPYYSAPSSVRERVLSGLESAPALRVSPPPPSVTRWRWMLNGALAGCAATVLASIVGTTALDWRENQDFAVEAVTAHVRATLTDHRIEVVSSNQHTVKPWLSARLDYSPPVRDFASEGFALLGGRIDQLDRQPIATLVYRYRDHMIDAFVRPETARAPPEPLRTVRGFHVAHASGSGMDWLLVSDLNAGELSAFAAHLAREE